MEPNPLFEFTDAQLMEELHRRSAACIVIRMSEKKGPDGKPDVQVTSGGLELPGMAYLLNVASKVVLKDLGDLFMEMKAKVAEKASLS